MSSGAGSPGSPSMATDLSVEGRDESGTQPWLVVIDPQVILASPDSAWGSPFFADAFANIERLAAAAGDRVLLTRWLPTADRSTSWGE